MMIRTQTGSGAGPASYARMMALALLICICFSSAVEVLHHHGGSNAPVSASSSEVLKSTSSTGTYRLGIAPNDCLVCQFQRNLSSTTFFGPVVLAAITTSQPTPSTVVLVYRSAIATTRSGRAPPFIS